MKKNQHKYGRPHKNTDSEAKAMPDVEEVLPPRSCRDVRTKSMRNRCCFISPEKRSFGQLTEPDMDHYDWYQNLFYDLDLDPLNPENATHKQLLNLQKMLYSAGNRVEIGSQYSHPIRTFGETKSAQWQTVDDTADIDRQILGARDEETITKYHTLPKHIHISEVPRVKVIAQKYHKYKQNNIELRKLDEKVVCVEYDVYDKSEIDLASPVQVMRAFFAFKPNGSRNDNVLKELPSTVKNRFNISSQDLQKLNEHEVEIIDGKIQENQPYLRDLKKILQRQQFADKKHKHSLNLQTLYEMANREYFNINTDHTNFLTKDELKDIRKLVLENRKSSAHGISRRAVKDIEYNKNKDIYPIISQTILNELLKED